MHLRIAPGPLGTRDRATILNLTDSLVEFQLNAGWRLTLLCPPGRLGEMSGVHIAATANTGSI